jgi:YcaO-like protein with predicted kinase domain
MQALVDPVAAKTFRVGTHRLIRPEETLDRVRRFFPVMGITRIADVTRLDNVGIPVVMVCRPNSRSLAVSQGKALDLMAAKASGVMESVESFMAERIVKQLKLGSYSDLRFTHDLVDVDGLPRTTKSIYHPDHPILWIEGQELYTETSMWVPYEMVHTAYTLPPPNGTGCFVGTSSGLASGNHYLEALSHAICEIVERDATTLHGVRTPLEVAARRLDLDSVDDPECREAISRIKRAGLALGVWNTTTDVGIAAFKCLIIEREQNILRPMYASEGMGCHPARNIALLRAITEAAQSRLTYISGVRDDVTRYDYVLASDRDLLRRQRDSIEGAADLDFHSISNFDSSSFDTDVAWELEHLRAAGIRQVVAIDLTRAEFSIPVVRVVVPGLEGPKEKIRSCCLGPRARRLIHRQ